MMDIIAQHAPLIGLLFFFSVFMAVAVWALNPGSKETIESYKYIPLTEESHDPR